MAEIGDTLLRAAQGIVAQLQGQTRLRMQQQQFSAQLQQAERTFSLRQQELEARQKLLDMQEQEFKQKQLEAPVRLDFMRQQTELMKSKLTPEAQALQSRLTESIIQKNLADTGGRRGGGLTAYQKFQARQKFADMARLDREREISEGLAVAYKPKGRGQAAQAEQQIVQSLSGLTLEELIKRREALQPKAGQISDPATQERINVQIPILNEFITQARGAVASPMTQEEILGRVMKINQVAPTDTLSQLAFSEIMNTESFPPERLSAIFGPNVNSAAGRSELETRLENDDVNWFAEQLRPRAVTPDGQRNAQLLQDFTAWVQFNRNDARDFLLRFRERLFGE